MSAGVISWIASAGAALTPRSAVNPINERTFAPSAAPGSSRTVRRERWTAIGHGTDNASAAANAFSEAIALQDRKLQSAALWKAGTGASADPVRYYNALGSPREKT